MHQRPLNPQSRLKPCLNCGIEFERDYIYCWNCGARRGIALQSMTNRNNARTSNPSFTPEKIEKEAANSIIPKLFKIIGSIIQLLIAIPIILYLGFALLCILIFIFFIVPIVIPLALKTSYLHYVHSALREINRSPFYISLISTSFSSGFLLLCGFLVGKWRMKSHFDDAVSQHEIIKICEYRGRVLDIRGKYLTTIGEQLRGYTFIPFSANRYDTDGYSRLGARTQHILIPPPQRDINYYLKITGNIKLRLLRRLIWWWYELNITALKILSSLVVIVFMLMLGKDYYVFKGNLTGLYLPLNLLADIILIISSLILSFYIGKFYLKQKITCSWRNSRAEIVSNCLCVKSWSSTRETYIIICPLEDLSSFSLEEAEKIYQTYQ